MPGPEQLELTSKLKLDRELIEARATRVLAAVDHEQPDTAESPGDADAAPTPPPPVVQAAAGAAHEKDAARTAEPGAPSPPRARAAAPARPLALRIEVLTGPSRGLGVALLPTRSYTVGRASTADIAVVDQTVSRHHCRLGWQDGALWVEDLGSSNGTLVNDQHVQRARLVPGEVIRVGETELRVDLQEERPEPQRPEAERTTTFEAVTAADEARDSAAVFSRLRASLRGLAAALAEAEHRADEAEKVARAAELRARASTARAEAEEAHLRAELAQTRQLVKDLERSIEGEDTQFDWELQRLRDELGAARSEASQSSANAAEASARLEALEEDLRALRDSEDRLNTELERQRMAFALAQAALADERAAHRDAVAQLSRDQPAAEAPPEQPI